ncbi:alpha/beta-hydrolase [Aaosphaeria arxii CBS 175.79]|uniref:Alpha/beta-hydrolase n=1 Tax=Aaosphaeria arxii CBS 175.79 TaxID=1450172 RepID=A0A6A5XCR3_9PLEO|nr:alpha/beta-hydrolase [Aaosphaeria arxii CBS 175.79]KAF2010564.1 alpha/beta-hydrolase [Aaosphaeria arxii CBS 175.79]
MAEYRHLRKPHPQWLEFPKNLPPGTRINRMSRERKQIIPDPALDISEFDIKARDGYDIRIRSYRRIGAGNKLPLFLYMHGGGFVTGSLETDDPTCRAWAKSIDLHVLNVEYRLAPEHSFPFGFEDCWDVLSWTSTPEAAEKLDVDLTKGFLVGGTSAGGNFTAGLAQRYLSKQMSPPITGLVLLASSFCHPDVRPERYRSQILSVDEIDDAPGLTKASIEYFWKKYGAPKDDIRYSPLLNDSWKGIAKKAYFSVCGWDPRRDEELLLGKILREDGLEVKEDVYPGLPHGFWTTCPDLEVSRDWEKDVVGAVKWMLEP